MLEQMVVIGVVVFGTLVLLYIVHSCIVTPLWRYGQEQKALKSRHDALIRRLAETGQITK